MSLVERERTSTELVMYALYLYFLGLSFRNTSKALEPFREKAKTVKVAVSYEEVYINDKKMKSVEEPQILSFLKDKLSSIGRKSSSANIDVKQSESCDSIIKCGLLSI